MHAAASRSRTPILALMTALCTGCAESTAPPVDDVPPPSPPPSIRVRDARLSPMVARRGEPFTLSLRIDAASSPLIHVHPSWHLAGAPDSLILFDDGTHGDGAARDGWFTLEGISLPGPAQPITAVQAVGFTFVHEPGAAHSVDSTKVRLPFRSVDVTRTGIPPITRVAGDARMTARVLALEHPQARAPGNVAVGAIVRRYFEIMPDDRDFLIVILPAQSFVEVSAARAYRIRNDVTGLNAPLGQFRDVGSASRLDIAVLTLSDLLTLEDGSSFCLFNHELSHRWMAYADAPLGSGDAHWGRDLARDHSVQRLDRGCVFNDLELYLAGLLPADSVANPIGRNGLTMNGFIQLYGERQPAYGAAQRNFDIGFVVASDVALSDHELAYFHHLAGAYTATDSAARDDNWWQATGGRSALSAQLRIPTSTLSAAPSRTSPPAPPVR